MIKTNQSKIVGTYKIVERLSGEALPLPVAYKLFKLKKSLQPHFDFQVEQENILFEQCGIAYKDNHLIFTSDENQLKFISKLQELNQMEVEIDIEKETLSLLDGLKLSINDMETLEDFIVFE